MRASGTRWAITLVLLSGSCHDGRSVAATASATTTAPAQGALSFDPAGELRIALGSEVEAAVSIDASSVELRGDEGSVAVGVTFDPVTRIAFLRPSQPLAQGTVHEVTVGDAAGSGWQHSWRFATRDDRTWQSVAIPGLVRRGPDGQVHAYWNEGTQARTASLAPNGGVLSPDENIGDGTIGTAGVDANGLETVVTRTGDVFSAYQRVAGGSWGGPVTFTAWHEPISTSWSTFSIQDGSVALNWFKVLSTNVWPTGIVKYDTLQGWVPAEGLGTTYSFEARAGDFISLDRPVVLKSSLSSYRTVASSFVATQPLAIYPSTTTVLPRVSASPSGQALLLWCAQTGDSWQLNATDPCTEGAEVQPTVLGSGPGTAQFRSALSPSGVAVVALVVGNELRLWRYEPLVGWSATTTTMEWSPGIPVNWSTQFAIDIDDVGDALLAMQDGDSVVALRGYRGLGWGMAETIATLDPAFPGVRDIEVLHDQVGGDLVRWRAYDPVSNQVQDLTSRRRL